VRAIGRILKPLARRIAPALTERALTYRSRKMMEGINKRMGLPAIFIACRERVGGDVLDGPFKGMKYITESTGSTVTPKLLGSYEAELHGSIERLLRKPYEQIIDVGCAEGYYAVGLARRSSGAEVIAYDIDAYSRKLCRKLANLNHVSDRLTIRGKCVPEDLAATVASGSLVVCDCEGFELELLDPQRIPTLRFADMLVELHPHLRPNLVATMKNRFRASHAIELIESRVRNPSDYPVISFLPPEKQKLALAELRLDNQPWLILTANDGAGVKNSPGGVGYPSN
jgi:Met-10+ like-protein